MMRTTVQTLFTVATFATPLVVASAIPATAQTTTQSTAEIYEDWSRYLAPAALNDVIQGNADVQVLDIRKEKYVNAGTIPGAVWIPFPNWRGAQGSGEPIPTEEELAALIGTNGLDLEKPIVIHNHADKTVQNGRAAIVYWILKSAGAENIAILNGGYKAWQAEGLPEADALMSPYPISVDVSFSHTWRADPLDIFSITSGQADGAILDARLDGQIRKSAETGQPMRSMPMAQYISASFFMNQLSSSKMSEEGQTAFVNELESRGIALNEEMLISICQTGELSALSWFYASEILGIENVRYYPDALKGWEGDGGLMFGMATPG